VTAPEELLVALGPDSAAGSTATAFLRSARYHYSDLNVMRYRRPFRLAAGSAFRRAPYPVLIVRGAD
jgi:hypothetical protein